MTDKQVIVDGVNVSGCEHYGKHSTLCYVDGELCRNNPNCYYKQLKRKEQSEARLVGQIQTICDFINNRPEIFKGMYGDVDKIIIEYAERKEQECERLRFPMKDSNYAILTKEEFKDYKKLKQTLTEIKPILELYANSKIGEEQLGGTYKITVKDLKVLGGSYIAYYDPRTTKQALQKINEVME